MNVNLFVANVLVICATVLQAVSGVNGPQPFDATAKPEAYAIYATLLPRLWAQEKGVLVLQLETDPHVGCPGFLASQTGDWTDIAADFQQQNSRVELLQRLFPKTLQYEFIRPRSMSPMHRFRAPILGVQV